MKQNFLSKLLVAVGGALTASAVFAAVIIATTAPPVPRAEPIPAPRAGFVWDPGHWSWVGGRYVWVGGHWLPVRPGFRWEPGRWVGEGAQWRWIDGRWIR
jgi:hypothetical protein